MNYHYVAKNGWHTPSIVSTLRAGLWRSRGDGHTTKLDTTKRTSATTKLADDGLAILHLFADPHMFSTLNALMGRQISVQNMACLYELDRPNLASASPSRESFHHPYVRLT